MIDPPRDGVAMRIEKAQVYRLALSARVLEGWEASWGKHGNMEALKTLQLMERVRINRGPGFGTIVGVRLMPPDYIEVWYDVLTEEEDPCRETVQAVNVSPAPLDFAK